MHLVREGRGAGGPGRGRHAGGGTAGQGHKGPCSSSPSLPQDSKSEPSRVLEDLAVGGMTACTNWEVWNIGIIPAVPAMDSNFETSQGYKGVLWPSVLEELGLNKVPIGPLPKFSLHRTFPRRPCLPPP